MKLKLMLGIIVILLYSTNIFSTTKIVTVQDYTFSPNPLNANVGDTIQWLWVSGHNHTTTSVSIPNGAATWDAPLTSATTTFIYVITVPGTYNYHCSIHYQLFNMVAVINVTATGIKQTETTASKFELKQNYPNPFNPSTLINFNIPQKSFVSIKIYDISGREIRSLVNSELNGGGYSFDFNANNLASGIYLYKLQAGEFTDIKKMMLIK